MAIAAAAISNVGASVTTLSPGSGATVSATLNSGVINFDFGIPQGAPGEVTQAQLSNDLVNNANATFNTIMPLTSNNSNAVQPIASTYADPEKEEIRLKIEELINALRR